MAIKFFRSALLMKLMGGKCGKCPGNTFHRVPLNNGRQITFLLARYLWISANRLFAVLRKSLFPQLYRLYNFSTDELILILNQWLWLRAQSRRNGAYYVSLRSSSYPRYKTILYFAALHEKSSLFCVNSARRRREHQYQALVTFSNSKLQWSHFPCRLFSGQLLEASNHL